MTGDIFPLQALHRYFHSTLFFPYTNYYFFLLLLLLYHISSSFFITLTVCERDNERVFLYIACIHIFYNYDKLILTNDNHKNNRQKEKKTHTTDTRNNR